MLVRCHFCCAGPTCPLALTNAFWGDLTQKATIVTFLKGRTIFREGFPAEGAFLLCGGSAKLTTISKGGMQRILDFIACGEMFGLDCLLRDQLRHTAAVAREDCQAAYFKKDDLCELLRSQPELHCQVMLKLNELAYRGYQEKLAVSGARVRDRIEHVLQDLAIRQKERKITGRAPMATFKQRELAELLGVPEETISRELRNLRSTCDLDVVPAADGLSAKISRQPRKTESFNQQLRPNPGSPYRGTAEERQMKAMNHTSSHLSFLR